MSNSLNILCTLLCLFHLNGASPIRSQGENRTSLEEILNVLDPLVNTSKSKCESMLVPSIKHSENDTIKEISCRAVTSLGTVCKDEKSLGKLVGALQYQYPKEMECNVDDTERKDLLSVLKELRSFVQKYYKNHS
ncbi:hypothetical protein FKM82_012239 [Ascaphus truei]